METRQLTRHDYALFALHRGLMRGQTIKAMLFAGLTAGLAGAAFAQDMSPIPSPDATSIEEELLSSIGLPKPKLTPLAPVNKVKSLPVKLLYDGPKLDGDFLLEIALTKPNMENTDETPQLVSRSTISLTSLEAETDALLNLTDRIDGLQIAAELRDTNQNLVLKTSHPIPVLSDDLRVLRLTSPGQLNPKPYPLPDITGVEVISGKVILPPKSKLEAGATLHVQIIENALAGGLSMELIAQNSRPIDFQSKELDFSLQRGVWDRPDTPDLSFNVWITDHAGRKTFVMREPTGYNGPDIDYEIPLENLRQGKNTKRGLTLNSDLMAQILIQGEAAFDPVVGIPGGARLNIQLKQDRGAFNQNPILAEQTLLLRGLETNIPFSLATDSTHFDPYAPAPFLSVSLTDINGRVYYASGDIRAREDNNSIRLFPR